MDMFYHYMIMKQMNVGQDLTEQEEQKGHRTAEEQEEGSTQEEGKSRHKSENDEEAYLVKKSQELLD
jgi:hypothetical protein